LLHGGSWLAVSASGRFAAVTNLRGSTLPVAARSRGFLIRDFMLSEVLADRYVAGVAGAADHYAGFHLIAGSIGTDVIHFSRTATVLGSGIHGFSNAAPGERWPKVEAAVIRLRSAIEETSREAMADDLLTFLSTPTFTNALESEVFISSDRYGTRSSTVIIATADEIALVEQSYGPGGVRDGDVRRIVLQRAI
ncbi:MAG: NRDE family protein, partial [Thermoanaerobaculia bacterium]